MSQIIVTLTTIPSRINYIQTTIDSILNQTLKPNKIELYIPKEYKKRSLGKINLDELPVGCEIIFCENDYGPATKILPALKKYENQDVILIYCDDDRIYEKNWIKRLISQSKNYPNDCITDEGANIGWYLFRGWESKNRFKYRFFRILSLGLWKLKVKQFSKEENLTDTAMGYGGILVKPKFFPAKVFDIPDLLWTVDDIWLSGMMTKNGINIRITAHKVRSKEVTLQQNQKAIKDSALTTYVYKGFNREDLNCLAIKYFIDNYKIWKESEKLCNMYLKTIKSKL